ncbi:MAG: thiamine pyrophosphate-dependent enzyme [Polyangiales bacterium]
MEMQQVGSHRTPQGTLGDDVYSVILPDGSADPATDPRMPLEQVLAIYEAMVRTRSLDIQLERLQRQGRIGFHIGSLGEEACILGSAAAFGEPDWLFPCYREFGALLWRGMPLQAYVNNMYGNAEDVVKGRQMPDHYSGKPYHYGSVSSPIGTQIAQAVGFAWAAKMKQERLAVGVYFGEGATSSNDFHTGMNFAGVFKTPNVFLCRNNRWAISVPSEKQTASTNFAIKGLAYGIRGVRCDGNDALATYETVRKAVERAKNGEGSTLVEMVTYRLGGHSTSDDPRVYRQQTEVEAWRKTDPILRLRKHLETKNAWDDHKEEALKQQVETSLKQCIEHAEQVSPPDLATMFEGVFKEMPWHLEEQRDALLRGPRAKAHH